MKPLSIQVILLSRNPNQNQLFECPHMLILRQTFKHKKQVAVFATLCDDRILHFVNVNIKNKTPFFHGGLLSASFCVSVLFFFLSFYFKGQFCLSFFFF